MTAPGAVAAGQALPGLLDGLDLIRADFPILTRTLADRPTREKFRTELALIARSQISKHEDPPGSNRTPYGAWYGLDGRPG